VSIGEALVDMIQLEDTERPTYLAAWGGSPFNVAVGVARLGSDVSFAGSFAEDALGAQLKDFLQQSGVALELCVDVEAQTTIAMTSFVNFEPQYSFYANPASYGFLPASIANRAQISEANVIHAGSLAVLEQTTFDTILESFRAAQGVVTFDPNVRPRMVSDWDNYRSRLGQLIALADFVKFSLEDIEAAYPNQTPEAVAMAALSGRTGAVLLSRGAEPVTLFTRDSRTDIPLFLPLPVADTTGGGDALMAGIIHQINQQGLPDQHDQWVAMVKQGLIVSGIVCSRRGGAIAMPTAEELAPYGFAY
jgi:fructokinase